MKQKAFSVFGILLIVVGLVLVVRPVYWYVSAHVAQNQLMQLMEEVEEEDPVIVSGGPHQLDRESFEDVDREEAEAPDVEEEPDGLISWEDPGPFIILIPRIDVEAAVVDGVEVEDLAKGPGFYPESPRPGQEGNVAVAGHRTTYGEWFRHVDELEEGDEILFTSSKAIYVYQVESVYPVASNAWEVVDPTEEPKLTLTTCHPVGSARERLVVRAAFLKAEER